MAEHAFRDSEAAYIWHIIRFGEAGLRPAHSRPMSDPWASSQNGTSQCGAVDARDLRGIHEPVHRIEAVVPS